MSSSSQRVPGPIYAVLDFADGKKFTSKKVDKTSHVQENFSKFVNLETAFHSNARDDEGAKESISNHNKTPEEKTPAKQQIKNCEKFNKIKLRIYFTLFLCLLDIFLVISTGLSYYEISKLRNSDMVKFLKLEIENVSNTASLNGRRLNEDEKFIVSFVWNVTQTLATLEQVPYELVQNTLITIQDLLEDMNITHTEFFEFVKRSAMQLNAQNYFAMNLKSQPNLL